LPLGRRLFLAYFLTDQAYAISLHRFGRGLEEDYKLFYYLGAGTVLWASWVAGTTVGLLLGARAPESWSLDFAVPLTFLALLVPAVRTRAHAAAAVAAGLAAVAAKPLPLNLGLITAALVGIITGMLVEGRRKP
ncbi:MAG: AzlC family ABC transporter permease, partial [Thermodesulfobacteriota bacterium]